MIISVYLKRFLYFYSQNGKGNNCFALKSSEIHVIMNSGSLLG